MLLFVMVLEIRARDFYDIFMLIRTQSKNINNEILKTAIMNTAIHRDTVSYIKEWKNTYEDLKADNNMKKLWDRYKKDNFYVSDIEYDKVIVAISEIGSIIDN